VPFIKTMFWNGHQRRLRTLWRLIGQLIIIGAISIVVEGTVGLYAFGRLMSREGISPDQLSDPQIAQRLVMNDPLFMALLSIGVALSFMISVWLAGRFLDRRPFAAFGFHLGWDWWTDFGFGLALGAGLMLVIFLVELVAGWLTVTGTLVTIRPDTDFLPAILVPLVTFLAVGLYEELFFRGYELKNLAEGLTWNRISPQAAIVLATLLTSAVFGVAHALNPNATAFSTLAIAFAGILLAAGYLLSGELAIPIGLHIAWNFFQGNVFGFPVSGTAVRSATFISVKQSGPDLWTGGAFGPEAGLLGLGAMIMGVLSTVLWVRWRYNRACLDLSLAEAPVMSPAEGPVMSPVERAEAPGRKV
jgi:membrane protease YdiL (CAAX protease family)